MSAQDLKALLDQVEDTRELVFRRSASQGHEWNALYDAWSDAHEEAEDAYSDWRTCGGGGRYTRYRAAADREDAAQDTLTFASA